MVLVLGFCSRHTRTVESRVADPRILGSRIQLLILKYPDHMKPDSICNLKTNKNLSNNFNFIVLKQYCMKQNFLDKKGQCHEITDTFYQKTPLGPNMKRQKLFHKMFVCVREDIRENSLKKCVHVL